MHFSLGYNMSFITLEKEEWGKRLRETSPLLSLKAFGTAVLPLSARKEKRGDMRTATEVMLHKTLQLCKH